MLMRVRHGIAAAAAFFVLQGCLPQPAPPVQAPAAPQGRIDVVNTGANFRRGPSTSSAIIRALPEGTRVLVLGADGKWLQVDVAGEVGFVHNSLIGPKRTRVANRPARRTGSDRPTTPPPSSTSTETGSTATEATTPAVSTTTETVESDSPLEPAASTRSVTPPPPATTSAPGVQPLPPVIE